MLLLPPLALGVLASLSVLVGAPAPEPQEPVGEAAAQDPSAGAAARAERLARRLAEARAAVEAALEVDLSGLAARHASQAEIAAALAAEAVPLLRAELERAGVAVDEDALGAGAAGFAAELARVIPVKYVAARDELLVAPETFAARATALAEPALAGSGARTAALAEGCVHAADERLYGWSETLAGLAGAEEVKAFNAVVLGHAQLVARRLARARPAWRSGYEAYARSFGRTGVDGSAGGSAEATPERRYAARIVALQLGAARDDGERFLARLEAAGGAAAIAHAFLAPPAAVELLHHPEGFLDPRRAPAPPYDLDGALDAIAARYDPDVWTEYRTDLDSRDLQNAFGLLGAEEVARIEASLERTRVLRLSPAAEPGSKAVVCGLYRLRTPADALHFVARTERLLRLKDERYREAGVLLAASHADAAGPGWQGFHARLRLMVGQRAVEVRTVVAARGTLAIELLFQGEEVERAALDEAVTEVLSRVLVARPAPEPADAAPVEAGGERAGGTDGGR